MVPFLHVGIRGLYSCHELNSAHDVHANYGQARGLESLWPESLLRGLNGRADNGLECRQATSGMLSLLFVINRIPSRKCSWLYAYMMHA